jgi:hypothetical protein
MSSSHRSRWAVRLAAALILLTTAGCTVAMRPEYTRVPKPTLIGGFYCEDYGYVISCHIIPAKQDLGPFPVPDTVPALEGRADHRQQQPITVSG